MGLPGRRICDAIFSNGTVDDRGGRSVSPGESRNAPAMRWILLCQRSARWVNIAELPENFII